MDTGAAFTGGAGNDTFDAFQPDEVQNTLGSADVLNGGAGTDTLNVYVAEAATIAPTLTAIENVVVTADQDATISLVKSSGYTSLTNDNSSGNVTFANINSTSVDLRVVNQLGDGTHNETTFSFAASAVSGRADSATLTVRDVLEGARVNIDGVETINITSTGTSNSVNLYDANAATAVVVSGAADLSLTTTPTTVTTVNAGALTGGLTYTANATTAVTVTGGSGNDAITRSTAANDSINAGAGNDTVTFTTGLAASDTLNGGEGTDTLAATSAQLTGLTVATTPTITNFETVEVTDALGAALTTATMVQAGISTVKLTGGTGAFTVTMEAGSRTVSVGAVNTGLLTVADTGSATTDSLTVTNTSTTGADVFNAQGLTSTGYETVTVNTTAVTGSETLDLGTVIVTPDAGGTAVLNITGSNKATVTSVTVDRLDVSGLTAASSGSTFVMTGASGIETIIGSAGNDTLVTDADGAYVEGGAGRDGITGGAGNDTMLGGDGNDTITAAAGNDSVLGGAGNDTLVFAGDLATGDVIDGGDGAADVLSVTNASLTTIAAYSLSAANALNNNISNVERVTISDDLAQSFDMARLDSINHIRISDWSGAVTLSGLAAGTTVLLDAAGNGTNAANDLTLALANATGSSDSLRIELEYNSTLDFGDVTVDDIESITINTSEATASTTARALVLDLTDSSELTTITITGTEGLNLSGVALRATTIDASGSTGAVSILGTSTNQTITGTGAADTLSGGGGADTISGGAGGDSIDGGAGADSLVGGTGADTITGGAGNDAISLTESAASVDVVVLNYFNAGADMDTITGFTTGSSGDNIDLSIAGLNTAVTGLASTATVVANHAGAAITAAASNVVGLTQATTLTGGDVFVLRGATFADAAAVEDALEAGGSFAITGSAAAFDTVGNSYMIVYTDGTDAYVAAAIATSQTDNDTDFEAGNLTVVNVAKLIGVSSIGASTFANANFDFIA